MVANGVCEHERIFWPLFVLVVGLFVATNLHIAGVESKFWAARPQEENKHGEEEKALVGGGNAGQRGMEDTDRSPASPQEVQHLRADSTSPGILSADEPRQQGAGARDYRDTPHAPVQAGPRRLELRTFTVTAYCACSRCCIKSDGITASTQPVWANGFRLVAAPPEIPFGTMLMIPGYNEGFPVPVLDRGGAIKGNRLDVFFSKHAEALKWGKREVDVVILWP